MSKLTLIFWLIYILYYSCSALPTKQVQDGKGMSKISFLLCWLTSSRENPCTGVPQRPPNYEDCPIGDPVENGLINNDGTNYLPEASGLAYSRRTDGVLWTFNDSGSGAKVYAISEQGDRVADVTLEGVENIDWEDIAINVEDGVSMIYIADMGNNGHDRPVLFIYKFPEPAVTVQCMESSDQDQRSRLCDRADIVVSAEDIETIEFTWPDYSHDCEALAVDPATGDMLLFTKDYGDDAVSEIYKFPTGTSGELLVLEYVGQIPHKEVTAAEISPSGDTLAIACYGEGWSYSLPEGQTWIEYLAADPTPCFLKLAIEDQREAITVTDSAYWTTSESSDESGGSVPLWYYERN